MTTAKGLSESTVLMKGFDPALVTLRDQLVAMALHATPVNLDFVHVVGGKHSGSAVALVVVGHGAGQAPLNWQTELRPIARLNLRFLIERVPNVMG